MTFNERLRHVFDRGAPLDGSQDAQTHFRYIPRAYSAQGSGWGVWDRKINRYLTKPEIQKLDLPQLDERWVQ